MAILYVLQDAPGHLSPLQVFARARRLVPRITATTVYRTLETLHRSGLVWQTSRAKGRLAYELAQGHHHHLVCTKCGKDVAVKEAWIESAYRQLETASGYLIDHSHVSLSGVCRSCRRASARE